MRVIPSDCSHTVLSSWIVLDIGFEAAPKVGGALPVVMLSGG